MKLILIYLALLLPTCVHADDIDYFLRFPNETAALSVLKNYTNRPDDWPLDYCIPGIQVWLESQNNPDGTPNYLSGFYVMCSFNRLIPPLANMAQSQMVINRNIAKQRGVAVLKSNVSDLQDLRFSPVVAGSDYPFGNMQ